jgi:hypothetical protein
MSANRGSTPEEHYGMLLKRTLMLIKTEKIIMGRSTQIRNSSR